MNELFLNSKGQCPLHIILVFLPSINLCRSILYSRNRFTTVWKTETSIIHSSVIIDQFIVYLENTRIVNIALIFELYIIELAVYLLESLTYCL